MSPVQPNLCTVLSLNDENVSTYTRSRQMPLEVLTVSVVVQRDGLAKLE